MNRITPLNSKLTNEQLFRYYLKETDPKLQVSDDVFGEDEPTTLADLITNKSLNKSRVNQTIQTDEGDDDDDDGGKSMKSDYSEQSIAKSDYTEQSAKSDYTGRYDSKQKEQNQSQSFVDRSSFLEQNSAPKQLENRIEGQDVGLKEFFENYDLEKTFSEMEGSPFNKKEAASRHGSELFSQLAENNAELGFVNDGYNDSINPMYEGSTNDFLSSIVGNIADNLQKKADNLQNSLMEAGADIIESISPIKRTRTLKPKKIKDKDMYITADERPTYNIMMRAVGERALAEYEARTNPLSVAAITKRGRPLGSKNKAVTPTNMKTRSSKDTEGFV
jgi:hypothetical protein